MKKVRTIIEVDLEIEDDVVITLDTVQVAESWGKCKVIRIIESWPIK